MKNIICILGPSGIGKSFYAKLLVEKCNFSRPRTITTRNPRKDDDNHKYVNAEEFADMIEKGLLLEWDEYAGKYYGILNDEFQNLLSSEKNNGIVMDLTLDGCRKVKKIHKDAVIVALLPDDVSWLGKRLVERGFVDAQEMERRMEISGRETKEIENLADLIVQCSREGDDSDKILKKICGICQKIKFKERI